MALAKLGSMAALAEAVSTVTVSLTDGWDEVPGNGPPQAGDVVALEVVKPEGHVDGPAGWTRGEGGLLFWKQIGPQERNPVFTAVAPEGWEIRGRAFSGFTPWTGG